MWRFIIFISTLVMLFGAQAAPLNHESRASISEKRQILKAIGGIGCNVARFQTVTRLGAASGAVAKLGQAAGADATAVNAASEGLKSARTGIAIIAGNILTGQTPSADARTQVENGLNAAKTALAGLTSPDQTTTDAAVTDAVQKVDSTIAAGQQVVAKC